MRFIFITILFSHTISKRDDRADGLHGFSGKNKARACSFFIHIGFYGTGIAYTVTSAISMRYVFDLYMLFAMDLEEKRSSFSILVIVVLFLINGCRAIQKSNCYHEQGHEAACEFSDTYYMLVFGIVQIILSQAPDFHNIQSLSIIAAVMSFSYSSIGFALGLAKVIGSIALNLLQFQFLIKMMEKSKKYMLI